MERKSYFHRFHEQFVKDEKQWIMNVDINLLWLLFKRSVGKTSTIIILLIYYNNKMSSLIYQNYLNQNDQRKFRYFDIWPHSLLWTRLLRSAQFLMHHRSSSNFQTPWSISPPAEVWKGLYCLIQRAFLYHLCCNISTRKWQPIPRL